MIYWKPVHPFKNRLSENFKKALKKIYPHTRIWGLPQTLSKKNDIEYLKEMKEQHPEYEKEIGQLIEILNEYPIIEIIETR